TFEEFYQATSRGLVYPKLAQRRDEFVCRIYEIEGLPRVYLRTTEYEWPDREMNLFESGHYLDIDSAVVPIAIQSHAGNDYHIL
ncbi:MAG: hypothetical protein KDA63_05200, partial [Planctomycetales bacterium]|nr:hypothetical protein [Planctomycetales bacterium]